MSEGPYLRSMLRFFAPILLATSSACVSAAHAVAPPPPCGADGVYLQVLGSGGPVPDPDRTSSSYLLWVDGRARALVDAGPGTVHRLAQAGAKVEDLELLVFGHLHVDHVGDVPALLKAAFFTDRRAPWRVVGPSGSAVFPDMRSFLQALVDPERGAYRYLSGYLDGSEGHFALDVIVADATRDRESTVFEGMLGGRRMKIGVLGVEHGPVPALAVRIDVGGARLVIGGDQTTRTEAMADFASQADLLVLHHAVPEGAGGVAARLHGRPSELGRLAADARARQLVLSHNMQRALRELEVGEDAIREAYRGPVTVASDLACFSVPDRE